MRPRSCATRRGTRINTERKSERVRAVPFACLIRVDPCSSPCSAAPWPILRTALLLPRLPLLSFGRLAVDDAGEQVPRDLLHADIAFRKIATGWVHEPWRGREDHIPPARAGVEHEVPLGKLVDRRGVRPRRAQLLIVA